MIYPVEKLLPIMYTLSPNFEATLDTCRTLTSPGSWCKTCYFGLSSNRCGASFTNPEWQASLDPLKLTHPEFFV